LERAEHLKLVTIDIKPSEIERAGVAVRNSLYMAAILRAIASGHR